MQWRTDRERNVVDHVPRYLMSEAAELKSERGLYYLVGNLEVVPSFGHDDELLEVLVVRGQARKDFLAGRQTNNVRQCCERLSASSS